MIVAQVQYDGDPTKVHTCPLSVKPATCRYDPSPSSGYESPSWQCIIVVVSPPECFGGLKQLADGSGQGMRTKSVRLFGSSRVRLFRNGLNDSKTPQLKRLGRGELAAGSGQATGKKAFGSSAVRTFDCSASLEKRVGGRQDRSSNIELRISNVEVEERNDSRDWRPFGGSTVRMFGRSNSKFEIEPRSSVSDRRSSAKQQERSAVRMFESSIEAISA